MSARAAQQYRACTHPSFPLKTGTICRPTHSLHQRDANPNQNARMEEYILRHKNYRSQSCLSACLSVRLSPCLSPPSPSLPLSACLSICTCGIRRAEACQSPLSSAVLDTLARMQELSSIVTHNTTAAEQTTHERVNHERATMLPDKQRNAQAKRREEMRDEEEGRGAGLQKETTKVALYHS